MKNPVLLAQIGAPHGIAGEVRIKSFTSDPLSLKEYGSLITDEGTRLKITRAREAKNVIIVKFKGINSRTDAEGLNGTRLYVDRSNLPDDLEEDEFYVTDLIGMAVVDQDGQTLGTIHAVPDFGAGDLLEISPAANKGSQNWFLEFTRANVPLVDLANGIVTVHPPEQVSERDQ